MNMTSGRHCGFIDRGRHVAGLIKASKAGLKYIGTVSLFLNGK